MAGDRALLTASGVCVSRGGRAVLDSVDLDLRRGEVVALLGPNGVGKSTLVAALAGLIGLDSGTVESTGRVAALLQAPLLANRTVAANLESALGWWGVDRSERPARAREALRMLGVESLHDRSARSLSGGEARRVHLARGIALQPEVLLLDEPFAGLDLPTRARLLEDGAEVIRDPDRATMVVVHDRAEAWALADRVVVLLGGRVAAAGPTAEVLGRPPTEEVATFLGFDGRLRVPDGRTILTRPTDLRIDPAGPIIGTVTARTPEEDGVLCGLDVPGGTVQVRASYPGPELGERVTIAIGGGVTLEGGVADASEVAPGDWSEDEAGEARADSGHPGSSGERDHPELGGDRGHPDSPGDRGHLDSSGGR